MNIRDALSSLTPTANWAANDTEVVEWLSPDIPQPTPAELNAEVARLQSEYVATQYQRDRAAAFASVGDQFDMQYWDAINDTTTWADHVADVKARFPK